MSNWGNFLLGNSYSEDIIKQTKFYSKRERSRKTHGLPFPLFPATERQHERAPGYPYYPLALILDISAATNTFQDTLIRFSTHHFYSAIPLLILVQIRAAQRPPRPTSTPMDY